MIGILVFGLVYLFGVYAFWKHAFDSAVRVDQFGNPIAPRGENVIPFRNTRLNVQGLKLSVPAVNPSRGGNA